MQQNKIQKITDYSPKAQDVFIFDNNIWMYIFCPLANFQKGVRQTKYSRFFEQILSRKLHIYINSLILSEFSNRYLRLDFDLINKSGKKQFTNFKKDYVGSQEYIETVQEIKTYLNQIIKVCQRCSDEFNAIDLEQVFTLFEKIGFNDSYYIHLAKRKNWIIVSDDSDFTNAKIPQVGLTILTL